MMPLHSVIVIIQCPYSAMPLLFHSFIPLIPYCAPHRPANSQRIRLLSNATPQPETKRTHRLLWQAAQIAAADRWPSRSVIGFGLDLGRGELAQIGLVGVNQLNRLDDLGVVNFLQLARSHQNA